MRRGIGALFATSVPAVALLVPSLLASGCQRDLPPRQRVIFILLDALRADRLSCYGYPRETTPHLDALARRGVLFRNHFVHNTATRGSLPEMLYSRYFTPPLFPGNPNVPLSTPAELFQARDDESISLPRALSRSRIRTAAISAHSWLREATAFARQFDELHDLASTARYPREFGYPRAEAVTETAIQWIREHRDEDFFLYLHYMDSHFPHPRIEETERFLDPDIDTPEVRRRFRQTGHPGSTRALQPRERRYLDALYDGSVAYADAHLGRLFAYLESVDALNETLIVVTSDHGEHLLEVPGRFEHGGPWYDTVAHAPLILSQPAALAPRVVDELTAAVDLMPTILELVGRRLPVAKSTDGHSLVSLIKGETRPDPGVVLAPGGVRTPTTKLLLGGPAHARIRDWFLHGGPAPSAADLEPELYDLTTDPLETENIAAARPSETERLLQVYLQQMRAPYLRHASSRRTEPPDSAFAIRTRDFRVEDVGGASPGPPPGWHREPHWQRYRLWADAGAPPIRVGFRVPSGDYTLSIAVRGAIHVTLSDGRTVTAKGAPVPDTLRRDQIISGDVVELGSVAVHDDRFTAELAPKNPDKPVLVRYFGFIPAGAEKADEELDERLRTLGYID